MAKFNLNNPVLGKVLGIVSVAAAGVVAVVGALSDQKKSREFEDMKKTVSELQDKFNQ